MGTYRNTVLKEREVRTILGDEWMTPHPELQVISDLCRSEYGFVPELDVATNAMNTLRFPYFWTVVDDALRQTWDRPWFCNPPYSRVADFALKAMVADAPGALLLPATRTDQRWFHVLDGCDYWFRRGRIRFLPPEGVASSAPRFANMVLIFSERASGAVRRW